MKTTRVTLLAAVLAATLLAPLSTASTASADSVAAMQSRVDAIIVEFGGVQTAPNEVSWDDGAVLDLSPTGTADDPTEAAAGAVSLSAAASTAVGGCAAGRHCAYSGSSYGGNKLAFSSCATKESVAALGTVRSIANSTTSKTVKAYAGSTLVATVAAGKGRNVSGAVTTLSCS